MKNLTNESVNESRQNYKSIQGDEMDLLMFTLMIAWSVKWSTAIGLFSSAPETTFIRL